MKKKSPPSPGKASSPSKKIALVYRVNTPKAAACAKDLAAALKKKNHEVMTAPEQDAVDGTSLMKAKDADGIDLIVVLGGDGTYLRAVHMFEGHGIPVLGFNMGSLGFLTVHPAEKVEAMVEKTLNGKMGVEPRTMIQATVFRGKKKRGVFHALNDIVLERGSHSQLINARILLDDRKVAEVKADGFVIATPTGSTAYNLAAGGPILEPQVRAFAITPVAPHALTTRPLIVPDEAEITLQLVEGKVQAGYFIVDGQKQLDLSNEDHIVLKKSSFDHLAVREKGFNDFHLLREKLKFGDRA